MLFYTDTLQNDAICLVLEGTVEGNDRGWVPAYHFAICSQDGTNMGICDLRIGHNEGLYYGGNIGYTVDAPYRGHHYAAQARLLLFQLARHHQMEYVLIACRLDNHASRRTFAYLGGRLLEIAPLPEDSDLREDGEAEECIFRFDL